MTATLCAANFNVADFDDRAFRPEVPAGKFVRRDDAMALLHALHHFEVCRIEIIDRPDAAKHVCRRRSTDAP